MNDAVTDKVRKLLKLSQGWKKIYPEPQPEHLLAAQRAEELMERHNLHVKIEDDFRIEVPDVAGVFWREQVITAVAGVFRCKVVKEGRGDLVVAVLVGDDSEEVSAAKIAYDDVAFKVMMECYFRWGDFNPQRSMYQQAEYEEIAEDANEERERLMQVLEEMSSSEGTSRRSLSESFINAMRSAVKPKKRRKKKPAVEDDVAAKICASVWFRSFLSAAAGALTQQLAEKQRKQRPEPRYEPSPTPAGFAGMRFRPVQADAEVETLTKEVEELAKVVGRPLASQLYDQAISSGTRCARRAWQPQWRRIAAASSFLPPPPAPSRFNQLDLDDNVVPISPEKGDKKKAPGGRRVEID